MKFSLQKTSQQLKEHDLLVIGAFKAKPGTKKTSAKKNAARVVHQEFSTLVTAADSQLQGHLIAPAIAEGFVGDEGQHYVINTFGHMKSRGLCIFGMGENYKQTVDLFRRVGGEIYKLSQRKRAASVGIVIPEEVTVALFDIIQSMAEGIRLASYLFGHYLTRDKRENFLKDVTLYLPSEPKAEYKLGLERALTLAESVSLARDVINEGPTIMNPEKFADHAKKVAQDEGLQIDVLDEKRLKKERMNLMLAVASASAPCAPPRLVRLHYKPKKQAKQRVALVGKGVMFDSGGLDIKTAEGMLEMKCDMSGAAAVLGTMRALAKLEPRVEVFGYMACVENGVGPHAYHPGDILVSRKGVTVDINNTDAEGRLILADAITYATDRDKPDIIIDVATLTAACMIALGSKTAGVFTNDDLLHEAIIEHGGYAGESFWRLPLTAGLKEALKSPVADIKNTGDRYGGAITAALFLQEFVEPSVRWAHLDIAGPAINAKPHAYLNNGGVGFGVRTLVALLSSLG